MHLLFCEIRYPQIRPIIEYFCVRKATCEKLVLCQNVKTKTREIKMQQVF